MISGFDVSKSDALLMALHDHLKSRRTAASPAGFAALSAEGRREYMRDAKARSRARQRTAKQRGSVPATDDNVRAALADAALMLLAVDGPGADQVRMVLASVFHDKAGVPPTVEARARSGQLRPKLAVRR